VQDFRVALHRDSLATSLGFKWGVCWSLTEVALDDLDPSRHFRPAREGRLTKAWACTVNHAHRAAWWLALWPALSLALSNAGCAGDDCDKQSHCNGDVLEHCESGSYGSYANNRSCGPGLCKGSEGYAFCALDKQPDEPDPNCRTGSSSSFSRCSGNARIDCVGDYVTKRTPCALRSVDKDRGRPFARSPRSLTSTAKRMSPLRLSVLGTA
jgi:hypothetical protein